jgi:four helix bundle protein
MITSSLRAAMAYRRVGVSAAETEASETQVHLEITFSHKYIDGATFEALDDRCDKIISQIVKMIDQANHWIIKPAPAKRRPTR